ncbi:nuclear transport factor 2 family protein [Nocardia heshunensis]
MPSTLVTDYLEQVWNQGRADLVPRFVAEDLIQHSPVMPDGRAGLMEVVETMHRAAPDFRFEVHRVAAEGDLVFAHSHYSTGPDDPGTAVVDIYRIAEGLIAEHWDVREPIPPTTVNGRPII